MDLKSMFRNVLISAIVAASSFAASGVQLANITDTSCTGGVTVCAGQTGHGCTSTVFSPETDGYYTLRAIIDNCESGQAQCTGCQTEVYLIKNDTPPSQAACIHSGCCSAQSTQVFLSRGVSYTLYCCKLPCEDNCAECDANCVSRAIVE